MTDYSELMKCPNCGWIRHRRYYLLLPLCEDKKCTVCGSKMNLVKLKPDARSESLSSEEYVKLMEDKGFHFSNKQG